MLRVGRIDFANCTPLFRALEQGDPLPVQYVLGVPTELNRRLAEGSLDLAPSSSVVYLADPDRFGFLPDLSISAIGPVASVLLFSRIPLEDLDGRALALSPVSATSVMLLRVLLEGRLGLHPRYDVTPAEADGVLWIGDRALEEVRTGAWPHVYDLGELWHRHTGTPFVFALWVCRRDAFERDPAAVRTFYRALVGARHRAYRSYPTYAKDAPQAAWLGQDGLLAYWQTISYDLTSWHLEGLRRFSVEAAALGLLPRVPALEPLAVEAGAEITDP